MFFLDTQVSLALIPVSLTFRRMTITLSDFHSVSVKVKIWKNGHDHLHVGHHVHLHVGHHNVISTLWRADRMEIRKCYGRLTDDGLTRVGAKDTCVSKNVAFVSIIVLC